MSVTLSLIFHNNNNMEYIVNASKKYFQTQYILSDPDCVTLIDDNNRYIIKITPRRLKFIITNNTKEIIDTITDSIKQFIMNNFINQTIGFKYYSSDKPDIMNIDGVRMIEV